MVLAIIFLAVAIVCLVSVLRQFKIKNYFALVVSAIAAASFGFFSVAEIICGLTSAGFCG